MAAAPPDPALLHRLKEILRRDLKLGADARIADDMPFFGSDFDFDSLDLLLLVTSIEKEFGVRIPNEAVGRTVFENVSVLARYIEDHRAAGSAPPQPQVDHLAKLPHGEAFRFVSKVTAVKEGESAEGVWAITGMEPFFAGHFPGRPIVPGVLIAEALAQVSGLAGTATSGKEGRLAQVDVRFDRAVEPPINLTLRSKLVRVMGDLQMFEVQALAGENIIARGNLTLHRS